LLGPELVFVTPVGLGESRSGGIGMIWDDSEVMAKALIYRAMAGKISHFIRDDTFL
jgi:hypothetical protein